RSRIDIDEYHTQPHQSCHLGNDPEGQGWNYDFRVSRKIEGSQDVVESHSPQRRRFRDSTAQTLCKGGFELCDMRAFDQFSSFPALFNDLIRARRNSDSVTTYRSQHTASLSDSRAQFFSCAPNRIALIPHLIPERTRTAWSYCMPGRVVCGSRLSHPRGQVISVAPFEIQRYTAERYYRPLKSADAEHRPQVFDFNFSRVVSRAGERVSSHSTNERIIRV